MSERFDFLIFIGRLQPLHIGHAHVIETALRASDRVIVLIGSANVSRSLRNPFTCEERADMVRHSFASAGDRLIVHPLADDLYNDTAWEANVQLAVAAVVRTSWTGPGSPRIGLVGHGKDGTSYYLKLFPQWDHLDVRSQYGTFNSTEIRAAYFQRNPVLPHDSCPLPVVEMLRAFRLGDTFRALVSEAEFLAAYRKSWEAAPYPPTFVTVDAVVEQGGHVLLIQRGQQPGKGLFALPGGFVDRGERLRDAVVRELREETGLADARGPLPAPVLAAYIEDRETRVFDEPTRSERGRTITHAFLFRLPRARRLWKVKGGDDAAAAQWARLAEIDPRSMNEDHYFILQRMLGL